MVRLNEIYAQPLRGNVSAKNNCFTKKNECANDCRLEYCAVLNATKTNIGTSSGCAVRAIFMDLLRQNYVMVQNLTRMYLLISEAMFSKHVSLFPQEFQAVGGPPTKLR